MDRGFSEDIVGIFFLAIEFVLYFLLIAGFQPEVRVVSAAADAELFHSLVETLTAGNESVRVADELLAAVARQDIVTVKRIAVMTGEPDVLVTYPGSSRIPAMHIYTGTESARLARAVVQLPLDDQNVTVTAYR